MQVETYVEVFPEVDLTKEIVGGSLGGLVLLALITAALYKVIIIIMLGLYKVIRIVMLGLYKVIMVVMLGLYKVIRIVMLGLYKVIRIILLGLYKVIRIVMLGLYKVIFIAMRNGMAGLLLSITHSTCVFYILQVVVQNNAIQLY